MPESIAPGWIPTVPTVSVPPRVIVVVEYVGAVTTERPTLPAGRAEAEPSITVPPWTTRSPVKVELLLPPKPSVPCPVLINAFEVPTPVATPEPDWVMAPSRFNVPAAELAVALFGRKINAAEHQPSFVRFLRLVADGDLAAAEGVRAYHGELQKLGVQPHRPLEADLARSDTASAYGG